jgi:hypothetical protein
MRNIYGVNMPAAVFSVFNLICAEAISKPLWRLFCGLLLKKRLALYKIRKPAEKRF